MRRPAPFRMVLRFRRECLRSAVCNLCGARKWGHQRCSEIYLDFCEPASKELSIRVVVAKKSTGKADLQRSDLHKELTAYPLRAAWF
jgi:hypothetical protein